MKKIIALTLLTATFSVHAQVEYKPRSIDYQGSTYNVSKGVLVQLAADSAKRGSHFKCHRMTTPVAIYNTGFGLQTNHFEAYMMGAGVSGIGHDCYLGSEADVNQKVAAFTEQQKRKSEADNTRLYAEAVARETQRKKEIEQEDEQFGAKNRMMNQSVSMDDWLCKDNKGSFVKCDYVLAEMIMATLDMNYSYDTRYRGSLVGAILSLVMKNYTQAERNNFMQGKRGEVNDVTTAIENLMTQNDIRWTSKHAKSAQTAAATQAPAPTQVPAPVQAAQTQQEVLKPSFDCAKAGNATEVAICQNGSLAKLDARFAQNYKNVLRAFSSPAFNKTAAQEERQAQRNWMAQRNACGSNVQCIAKAYIERNDALCNFGVPNGTHPCTEAIE